MDPVEHACNNVPAAVQKAMCNRQQPRLHALHFVVGDGGEDLGQALDLGLRDAHAEQVPVEHGLEDRVHAVHDHDGDAQMASCVLCSRRPPVPRKHQAEYGACEAGRVGALQLVALRLADKDAVLFRPAVIGCALEQALADAAAVPRLPVRAHVALRCQNG
eukprot:199893-Chlamydomonas_euryale.AAC.1